MVLPPILLEGDEPSITPVSIPVPPQAGFAGRQPWTNKATPPETDSLPEAYGTGKLCLLARDSDCIYAHWDLSPEQQHRYNTLSADRHLVLRVYILEKRGIPFREIHLHPESQSWFVYVDRGGSAYVAELGYYTPGAEWIAVAHSEPISTPPATVSSERLIQFATVEPIEFPGARVSPEVSHPLPASAAVVVCGQVVAAPVPENPEQVHEHLPAAEAHRASRLAPVPAVDGETLAERFAHPPVFTLMMPEGVESLDAPTSAADWTESHDLAIEQIVTTTRVSDPTSSLETIQNVQKVLEKELASMAAAQRVPPQPGALPASVSSFAMEQPEAISSELGQPPSAERQFWFMVNAELVIYGATDPTASVTIGERRIRLRPDGTFTYRFALPDGNYGLPITATSVDDDRRHVALTFSRNTVSRGEVGKHPQDPALRPPAVENLT